MFDDVLAPSATFARVLRYGDEEAECTIHGGGEQTEHDGQARRRSGAGADIVVEIVTVDLEAVPPVRTTAIIG